MEKCLPEAAPAVPPEALAVGALPNDILIVEDDLIIALDLEETILRLGAQTTRTATSVAQALDMITARKPDFALLNVSLGNETSTPIAERLHALGIGFGFVTGHTTRAGLLARFPDKPRLGKPFARNELEAALRNWTARQNL